MRRFSSLSIRTHLLSVVLLAMMPALGIILYSGYEQRIAAIKDAQLNALRLINSLGVQQESFVRSTHQFLMTLAVLPEIRNRDAESSNTLLAALLPQSPQYSTISAVDARGDMFASGVLFSNVSVADRKYFKDVLRTRDFSVGEYVVARVVPKPVLHFAYPVIGDGDKLYGVVLTGVDLSFFEALFKNAKLSPGSELTLFDHKGLCLYKTKDHERYVGKPDPEDLFPLLSGPSEEGMFSAMGKDHIRRLYAFKRFSLRQDEPPYLYMRVSVPETQIIAGAKTVLIRNLLLLLFAVISAISAALILGNISIVNRIKKLAAASQKLAAGDLTTRIWQSYGNGELDMLGRAFNDMGEALSARERERSKAEEVLRASESKARAILDQSVHLMGLLTLDGTLIDVNGAALDLVGAPSSAVLDKPFWETPWWLHSAELQERLRAAIKTAAAGETVRFEATHPAVDGSLRNIDFLLRPVKDEAGKILFLIPEGRDITERKQAEEELRLNEKRLATLLELNLMTVASESELTHFAMEAAVLLTNSSIGYVAFANEDESILTMYAWSKEAMRQCAIENKPIMYRVCETGLWGEAIRQRRAVITNDYAAPNPLKKGVPDGHVQVRRHMNAPIFDGDRVIIVAGVGNKPTDYGDDDVRQLTLLMSGMWAILRRRRAEQALLESEERFRSTFEQAAVGIAHVSPDGRFMRINKRFCDIVGYTPDEIVTLTFQDITYPGDLQVDLDHVRELIEGRSQTYSMEKRYIRMDGSLVWVNLTVALLREPDGKPKYFISVIEDIGKRKMAEEALRLKDRALASSVNALIMNSLDGHTIYFNEAFLTMYGYTSQEAAQLTAYDLAYTAEGNQRIFTALQTQGFFVGEDVAKRKDGSPFPVAISASTITDIQGQPVAMMGSFIDITEQKAAEAEIVAQRERLQGIAVNVPGVVYQFYALPTGEYGMSYASERATEVFELQGNIDTFFAEFVDRVHPDDRDAFIASIHEAVETVSPWHYEGRFVKQSGDILWFSGASNPTRLPDRIVFNGMLLDITERRRSEEERKTLQIQLVQAQKMESLGTLAGGIAHDFNNILAAIMGYSELAKSDLSEPEKVKAEIEQVLKAADRAKDLVSQILTFSRKAETTYSPLEFPLLVKESLKMLRSVIPTTIEIRQNVIKSGIVMSDPTQIHQLIMNLCVNAAHAMEKTGGTLTVNLKKEDIDSSAARDLEVLAGHYLKLSISDTGHGMSPEVIERIFEPYFTTKELGRGTGLGLSVVHGIVKTHSGAVTCISAPGDGTTFNVYLPEIEMAIGETDTREKELIPTGSERILFVDDEPALADMVGKMLSKLGYQATTRTGSRDALDLFKKNPDAFDLVISDMTMPGMTGDKLAREIMEIRHGMPIILCTGYSELISEKKAREIGISELVMKPFEAKELAKTIRKVLDKK